MGRKDVEEILEKNPDRWFTIKELVGLTGLCNTAVWRIVRRNTGYHIMCKYDGAKCLVKSKNNETGYNSRASISHNVDYATESEEAKA